MHTTPWVSVEMQILTQWAQELPGGPCLWLQDCSNVQVGMLVWQHIGVTWRTLTPGACPTPKFPRAKLLGVLSFQRTVSPPDHLNA